MLGPIDFQSYLIVALVFVQLELIFPLRAGQKVFRRHWQNDLVNLLLNGVIIQFGLLLAIGAMMAAIRLSVPAATARWAQSQPFWVQVAEVLLVADLGFYTAHRAFHKVPFLWRFHAVHHSIEEMDWLAAYRVHPLDQILTKSASLLPVYALGFSNGAILAFALIYKWQSLAIHSNTSLGLGPLRWLLASPQFHHWHHAHEPAARDKNFAGQLPFLDALFGTLYMPISMPGRYGIDDPVPARYDRQLIYPLRAKPATSIES
jgi:sterol desaturase/sphingolipid hydroxylase (fatty acid hydroxylase superfamily)